MYTLSLVILGGGKFIKSVGEENQILKIGREYHGCGEEYNVKKWERGNYIIFFVKLWLLGRISSREKGKGRKFWGKIMILKNWGGEEYTVIGNFIHAWSRLIYYYYYYYLCRKLI